MFSKIRHFVNFITLKSIYDIFESHLNYWLLVSAQNVNSECSEILRNP